MSWREGMIYAHSPRQPGEEGHTLLDHLREVARLAAQFADSFDAGPWGHLAGLWHDLGKFQPEFQTYLRGEGDSVQHSIHGALFAQDLSQRRGAPPSSWLPLAWVIAGHHAGLANFDRGEAGDPTPLRSRLREGQHLLAPLLGELPDTLCQQHLPELPARLGLTPGSKKAEREAVQRSTALWTRFLFSALVDADFLDTERFYQGVDRQERLRPFDNLTDLADRLDTAIDQLAAQARPSIVNQCRASVLDDCRRMAREASGFFSLSVPTGGGKTLSAMSFALNHARANGQRRVIAVVPFTSIIEQNAKVYRDALGTNNVIEHHSNLDPEKECEHNKLASENWDAPIIVTTAVQFFESCFANRSSRCRKLHNVARSVVVLDEVQSLPPGLLTPILELLTELRDHYGCTVVFSTATQPAFAKRTDGGRGLAGGLDGMREIVEDPRALATTLERYEVHWPRDPKIPTPWPELADELAALDAVLVIVHRRRDARDLARLLPEEGLFHLSALMCAAHRLEVLKEAQRALGDGSTCRLVSTQLIEAGVDIDFPTVYRALGGLDSIVQAGGRCNREAREALGRLMIFRAPTKPPPGTPTLGLETTESLLTEHRGTLNFEDPATITSYFERLYAKRDLDRHAIQPDRAALNFATVARRFRMIEDFHRPVVVPYGDAPERLERFRNEPNRRHLRALQPYLVTIPQRQLDALTAEAAVETVHDTVAALAPGHKHLYNETFGLVIDEDVQADPAALVT